MGGLNIQSAQTGEGAFVWALLAFLALAYAGWRMAAALKRFDDLDLGLGYDAHPAPARLLAWAYHR